MRPLSEAMIKLITDTGSTVIAVVAKIQELDQLNDLALQSWAKEFAIAVARYRGIHRILSKERDTSLYIESVYLKDALITADNFMLEKTHWTWDQAWLDPRWKRAALERKKIWQAEEEHRRKLREEEENRIMLAEAHTFLNTELLVFDYPTEEEWQKLRNQPPLQEDPAPITLFDPTFDIISKSSFGSVRNFPSSFTGIPKMMDSTDIPEPRPSTTSECTSWQASDNADIVIRSPTKRATLPVMKQATPSAAKPVTRSVTKPATLPTTKRAMSPTSRRATSPTSRRARSPASKRARSPTSRRTSSLTAKRTTTSTMKRTGLVTTKRTTLPTTKSTMVDPDLSGKTSSNKKQPQLLQATTFAASDIGIFIL
ncbi:uncharacterized protein C8R40DRAFT_1167280 [Lentinula edodes]|uniref:uncharacterized protein n=1 Tax=Lentinula edodes TaxID=5353 RepID=UPI001E8E5EEE|nr:uncharacterized protein C8R40DRAFT_1167280 [Lentinula edodes]KAH7878550.1 hypothetical protein C8R40DRAFT_1167280 [Lentinula edodes]